MARLQAKQASYSDIIQALPKSLQIPQWRTKQMCYRVIKIFSGLMKMELWIKNASQGATDCERYIYVPFHDPEAYAVTTHELSHIYFEGDMLARERFVEEFSKRLLIRFRRAGSPVAGQPTFPERLKGFLRFLTNLFEDQRVHALWGQVYPGDHIVLEQRWLRLVRQRYKEASGDDGDFMAYTFFVARGIGDEVDRPRAEFVAIRPALEQAFQEVKGVDFVGCLVIVRKTVEKILNVLLDYLDQDEPQSQQDYTSSQSMQGQQAANAKVAAALGDDSKDGDDGDDTDGQSGRGQDDVGDGDQKQAPPDMDDIDRRRALMLQLMSQFCQKEDDLAGDDEMYGDAQPSAFQKKSKQKHSKAAAISDQAFGVNPWDSDDYNAAIAAGEEQMVQKIQEARSWVQNIEADDWLTKDSKCKVIFHDVTPDQLGDPIQLSDKEDAAARRLKSKFIRILGAKRATLEDAGDELDVECYIESLFDPTVTEMFEDEEAGAGFYALILCDMSGSMSGNPFKAVELAEATLRRAMDFPFVEIEKWGFTQRGGKGRVDLFRFDPKNPQSAARIEGAWGLTPLHEALRVAARQCMCSNRIRRLFVLTDGYPVYESFSGGHTATSQLLRYCKMNVDMARQNNVGVYGLMIGHDLDDKELTKLFGSTRHWRRARGVKQVTDALVSLVESQFVEYLRTKH